MVILIIFCSVFQDDHFFNKGGCNIRQPSFTTTTQKKTSSPKIQVVKMIKIDDVIGGIAICAIFLMAWVATP